MHEPSCVHKDTIAIDLEENIGKSYFWYTKIIMAFKYTGTRPRPFLLSTVEESSDYVPFLQNRQCLFRVL